MATVYSLICWGGRTGKTVSISATTDYVTLTNHGLRNGKGVAFVSGTLPTVSGTALALNTTYYAKGISTSTFELYYDSGLTSKIDFTSNGASLVMKSAYLLGLSSLARWGDPGSELIYDGLVSWYSTRSTASDAFTEEICEIGEAFDELTSSSIGISMKAPSVLITTMVNGSRSSGFHGGVIGAGYCYKYSGYALQATSMNVTFDGFSTKQNSTYTGITALSLLGINGYARNMIFSGNGKLAGSEGVRLGKDGTYAINCLAVDFNKGFSLTQYIGNMFVLNCISTKNNIGFGNPYDATSNVAGTVYNCISVGNTTNWFTYGTNTTAGDKNAGLSGEAWVSGSGTRITIATTDFRSFADNDFRPRLFDGTYPPQVDTGTEYYSPPSYDIAGYEVPSYNNGGAESRDVGCYEFDRGFGPHPASHTLTLTNVVVGSRVHIRDQADTVTHYDQIATASPVVIPITVYSDTRDNWRIKVRKASAAPYYQPWETIMTATAGASSIYVSQIPD